MSKNIIKWPDIFDNIDEDQMNENVTPKLIVEKAMKADEYKVWEHFNMELVINGIKMEYPTIHNAWVPMTVIHEWEEKMGYSGWVPESETRRYEIMAYEKAILKAANLDKVTDEMVNWCGDYGANFIIVAIYNYLMRNGLANITGITNKGGNRYGRFLGRRKTNR